jgi:predicted secreted protein
MQDDIEYRRFCREVFAVIDAIADVLQQSPRERELIVPKDWLAACRNGI